MNNLFDSVHGGSGRRLRHLSIRSLGLSAIVAMSFISQSPVLAQNMGMSDDREMLLSDQPLITTASKSAQRASDVPAAVSVITSQQIEAAGVTTLTDALRLSPGVDVIQLNSARVDVSIRGFNQVFANKLLVMIDGRSVYQDVFGTTFWNLVPIELSRIDRIEIVRGPGSALYGANALNGVINIITKHPLDFGLGTVGVSADIRHGDRAGLLAEVNKRIPTSDHGALIASAGIYKTDGLGARGSDGKTSDYVSTPVGTLDFENQLKFGILRLTGNVNQGLYNFATPYFTAPETHFTDTDLTADFKTLAENPLEARIFRSKSILTSNGSTVLDSETTDFELQKQIQAGSRNQIVVGGNLRQFRGRTMIVGAEWHGQQTIAGYIQDALRLSSRSNLFAGVRYGHNSEYGSTVSPRLSLVDHITPKTTFRLSYGNSYQAPTVVDSFINLQIPVAPGIAIVVVGNPHLKPVRVDSLEAGLRTETGSGYVALNVFDNRITNDFAFAPTSFFPGTMIASVLSRVNGPVAHSRGAEIELQKNVSRSATLFANTSYQDVTNANGQVDFSPKWKANIGILSSTRSRTTWSISERYVDSAIYHVGTGLSHIPTDSHLTTDVSVGLPLSKSSHPLVLNLSIMNMFDKRYFEVPLIPDAANQGASTELRRTFWIGIKRIL